MGNRLTLWILAALVAGLATGTTLNHLLPAESAGEVAGYLSLVIDVFLRLIRMIIAPLVLASLIAGIGHMGGDAKALGRIGGRAIAWFVGASFLSILIGIVSVNLLKPGAVLHLPLPDAHVATGIDEGGFSLHEFATHLVPSSIVDAMATNEILQIVVFSVFAGVALAAMGERGKPLLGLTDGLMELMLVVTGYVMLLAPPAVFAAVAAIIAEHGLGILLVYGRFMGGFFFALLLLMGIILAAGGIVIGGRRVLRLMREIREPFVLAFSTASSEAAYPRIFEALGRFGVPERITAFILPLGYSFNLDGSMMYCSFAVIFLAQAYGIELTFMHEVTMLLILMATSKGMAGVPRASLVVIAATLQLFGIPEAGLVLILGVDHFLDMGRSATNVVGNSVATAVVAHWERNHQGAPARPQE